MKAPKTWQGWTEGQEAWLGRLRAEGRTAAQIAREMGRTEASVKCRLLVLDAPKRTRLMQWAEVLSEPRPVRQTAAIMRTGVHAVKQAARKLRRLGFDVPRVRKRKVAT